MTAKLLSLFFIGIPCLSTITAHNANSTKSNKDSVILYKYYCECQIYTYRNVDSNSKRLAKTIYFDQQGNTVGTLADKYKIEMTGKIINFYNKKNQLIEQWTQPNYENTSVTYKTNYTYNSNNQVQSEITFSYEKRLKKPRINKGDVITEEDYEENKTWDTSSYVIYAYDNKGRLIKEEALKSNSNQDLYTYSYYSDGKIREHISTSRETGIIWVEKYEYRKDTVRFERTWYDGYGKPKSDPIYYPATIYNEIYKDGNLIQKYAYRNDNGEIFLNERYFYDQKNRLIKELQYDNNNAVKRTEFRVYPESCDSPKIDSVLLKR